MATRPYLDAHRAGVSMWIDMLHVPASQRGMGTGRKLYANWEAHLPKDIELVRVFAADTEGFGNSDGFWQSLGFSYRYAGGLDELSYEAAHTLVKGVNGHPTPKPLRS